MTDRQQLSADYIRKVARLARLAVDEDQVPALQERLSAVVTYVDQLRRLDLTGVEPLANVAGPLNRLDDDVPGPTIPSETLATLAPESLPPFIKVPKVLDEGGGA
jgi:aspartyl-tRNA(Asn)/glutamyl-tRNA(Gln) amidotransferase subunit C